MRKWDSEGRNLTEEKRPTQQRRQAALAKHTVVNCAVKYKKLAFIKQTEKPKKGWRTCFASRPNERGLGINKKAIARNG